MRAPFLAPERDDAYRRARGKTSGGTTYYFVPNAHFVAQPTTTIVADFDQYMPWYVDTPIVIDQLAFEVTTAGTNTRAGIYAADRDLQPTRLLLDSGSIGVGTTGVKTFTFGSPLSLPRGRYLTAMNADATGVGVRSYRAGCPSQQGLNPGATFTYGILYTVGRSYAAFPDPGTAWTAANTSSTPQMNVCVFRVTNL